MAATGVRESASQRTLKRIARNASMILRLWGDICQRCVIAGVLTDCRRAKSSNIELNATVFPMSVYDAVDGSPPTASQCAKSEVFDNHEE